MNFSVLQVGQLPPPFGGITTHIAALKRSLDEYSIENDVAEFATVSFWQGVLRCDIIHSHDLSAPSKILLPLLRVLRKRVILGVHGDGLEDQLTRNQLLPLGPVGKVILRIALHYYNAFIVGNTKIKQFLISIGVRDDRVFVIPEFIPTENPWDYQVERPDIASFVGGRKLFFMSGDVRKYNGVYLYGYDLVLEFARTHRSLEEQICFFINLSTYDNAEAVRELNDRVVGANLQRFVYINTVPLISALSLIGDSFALIRATNTDGNAVSILEALYRKVPVIASDIVDRPESCVSFKNRDCEDLSQKILYVLDNHDNVQAQIREQFDSFYRIWSVYESLR